MTDLRPAHDLHDYSRSRAVVIGTWDYEFLTAVPAARNSLDRMVGLLTGPLCGWPDDRLLVLANQRDLGDLPDRIITAFEDATDVALFYYVGHGQIDMDDQLCLGLARSRAEPNRRAATSLSFPVVRRALLDSSAATKIVILDCCFAGLASRPAATLAAFSGDVLDKTAGTGAYTMAATSAYATAWYETGPDTPRPQTFFTRYLADQVESGMPGQPAGLRLHPLFTRVRDNLARDQRPIPEARSVDAARDFVFAHNAAPPQTHRDPELEVKQLAQRLADVQAGAEARERALRAEVAERTWELQRLQKQARRAELTAEGQHRQLREDIRAAERRLVETSAAQAAAAADMAEGLVAVPPAAAAPTTSPAPESAESESPPSVRPRPVRPSAAGTGNRARRLFSRVPVWLGGLITLAAAAAVSLYLVRTTPPAHPAPSPHSDPSPHRSGIPRASPAPLPSLAATLPDPSSFASPYGGGVRAVAFSPDGTLLAVGDADDSTYLWDVATHGLDTTFTDPDADSQGVFAVAFSPDGMTLAASDSDGSTYLWDVATHGLDATLTDPSLGPTGVEAVAFSPDGNILATGDADGRIYLWDVATRKPMATLTDPDGQSIGALAFSPDGMTLAANGTNGYYIYLWDVATRRPMATLTNPVGGLIEALAFSPDGKTLATTDDSDSTSLWDVATRTPDATTLADPYSQDVQAVAFSPDGKILATGDQNGSTYLWHVG